MIKTCGVGLGIFVLGLVGLGAPAGYAKSWAAGEATGSETSTANAATSSPAAESTPAELRQRIESLKAQLADLNAELDASKDTP